MPRTATLPDPGPDSGPASAPAAEEAAAALHYRALENLYASAPVNALFASKLAITGRGISRIEFEVDERVHHAAGAAHGTIYFKMIDDAAFYAANSLVTDRFLLTTGFNLHFTAPIKAGKVVATGQWISGKRRVFVAEAHLVDEDGEEIGRGTGTFMRSHIALSGLPGYLVPGG
jgi:uncharacterized protein (TIGR00369 family)